MGDQSFVGQVVKVLLADGRADLVSLDPALRQAGPRRRAAPTGRSPLRLRRRLLRPLQSRHLLFLHCRRRGWNGAAALNRWQAQRMNLKTGEGKMREHCSKISARFLIWSRFRVATGRPGQSCQIPKQSRKRYVEKKAAQESRRLYLIPSEYRGLLCFARFPKYGSH